MTHKTTWANSDSLTVGFGPNYAERDKAAVVKRYGAEEEAVLQVTWESTFGESATYIQLPKYTVILSSMFRVDTAWAGGTSLSVGHTEADTADVDALHLAATLATANLTPAGIAYWGDGVYFKDTNSLKLPAIITDDFDDSTLGAKVFFTSTGTWTAGEGTLIVRYIKTAGA